MERERYVFTDSNSLDYVSIWPEAYAVHPDPELCIRRIRGLSPVSFSDLKKKSFSDQFGNPARARFRAGFVHPNPGVTCPRR